MNTTHTWKDTVGSVAVLLTILLGTLTGVHAALSDVVSLALVSLPILV